jgi:hypothetical protein
MNLETEKLKRFTSVRDQYYQMHVSYQVLVAGGFHSKEELEVKIQELNSTLELLEKNLALMPLEKIDHVSKSIPTLKTLLKPGEDENKSLFFILFWSEVNMTREEYSRNVDVVADLNAKIETVRIEILRLERVRKSFYETLSLPDEKASDYLRSETKCETLDTLVKWIAECKTRIDLKKFGDTKAKYPHFDLDFIVKSEQFIQVYNDSFLRLSTDLEKRFERLKINHRSYLAAYGKFLLTEKIERKFNQLLELLARNDGLGRITPRRPEFSSIVRSTHRTYRLIQNILNAKEDVICERIFANRKDDVLHSLTESLRNLATKLNGPQHNQTLLLLILSECSYWENLQFLRDSKFKCFSDAYDLKLKQLNAALQSVTSTITSNIRDYEYVLAASQIANAGLSQADQWKFIDQLKSSVTSLIADLDEARARRFALTKDSKNTSDFISGFRHLVSAKTACESLKIQLDYKQVSEIYDKVKAHVELLEGHLKKKFESFVVKIMNDIEQEKFSNASAIHCECIEAQGRLNIAILDDILKQCSVREEERLREVVGNYTKPQQLLWRDVVDKLNAVNVDYRTTNYYAKAADDITRYLDEMLRQKFESFLSSEKDFLACHKEYEDLVKFCGPKSMFAFVLLFVIVFCCCCCSYPFIVFFIAFINELDINCLPKTLVPKYQTKFFDAENKNQILEDVFRQQQHVAITHGNVSELIEKYHEMKMHRLASFCTEMERICEEQVKSLCSSLVLLLAPSDQPDIPKILIDAAALFQWKPMTLENVAKFAVLRNNLTSLLERLKKKLHSSVQQICAPLTAGALDLQAISFYSGVLIFLQTNDDKAVRDLFEEDGLAFDVEKQNKWIISQVNSIIEVELANYECALLNRDALKLNNFYIVFCRISPLLKQLQLSFGKAGNDFADFIKDMDPFLTRDVKKELEALAETLRAPLVSPLLTPEMRKIGQMKRDEHFRFVNQSVLFLEKFSLLNHPDLPFTVDALKKCLSQFRAQVQKLYNTLESFLPKLSDSIVIASQFNIDFNILRSLKQNLSHPGFELEFADVDLMATQIISLIDAKRFAPTTMKDLPKIMICIEKLRIFTEIDLVRTVALKEMEQFFRTFKRDGGNVFGLETLLLKKSEPWCLEITQEFSIFKGAKDALLQQKMISYKEDVMITNLKAMNPTLTDYTIDVLMSRYKKFQEHYDKVMKYEFQRIVAIDQSQITDTTFTEFDQLQSIIRGYKNLKVFENYKPERGVPIPWPVEVKERLHFLVAHIFGLWSLRYSAQDYYEAHFDTSADKRSAFILQPHATQVLAIFRLLGLDSKSATLESQLVQIGTGEGKSVALAVVAIVLALHGMHVNCACYSPYLSKRDFETFEGLFTYLGLRERIQYGTFHELCESIINRKGDIRSMTERFFLPGKDIEGLVAKKSDLPYVLLIDEADVLFSDKFYSATYTASVSLTHALFKALALMIWKLRDQINTRELVNSKELKKCCDVFPRLKDIIVEAAKDMLYAAKNHLNHKNNTETRYRVNDVTGQIEYKDISNGTYSSDLSYGYHTMYAYFYEYEAQPNRQKVMEQYKENSIALTLRCGNFSYAEVPLYFGAILGVSGTLPTPDVPQHAIVTEEYDIKQFTVVPSVFSKGPEVFNYAEEADLFILPKKDYYKSIVNDIEGKIETLKRPVIVFFDSEDSLMSFFNSVEFSTHKNGELRDKCQIYDENTSDIEVPKKISNAVQSGALTLASRSKGRGTDLRVSDAVSAAGGLHVIQTFLSEDVSEEIQIKGRTARMSCKGIVL